MILKIDTPRWALDFLRPARYKGIYGGRGSGKSHFVGEYIIEDHVINPNTSTVCIREVQKTLDQSVKRLLESKIESLNAGYYFEVQDAKIKSNHGDGLITFQGMQNHTADSIKSLEGYKRAWVEEAQTLTQYSLDLLRPTIRMPESEIIFTWNPRYKTDPVDVLIRKNPPPNTISKLVNWRDNPWFPDVLMQEREFDFKTDPIKANHIWEGAYGSGVGSILGRWVSEIEMMGRINDDVMYDYDGAGVELSCDLGFHDTTYFWYWQRKPGGYSVIMCEGQSGWDAQDWIERIKEVLGKTKMPLRKIWMPHDARAKTFQSKYSSIEQFVTAFGSDKVSIVPQSKKEAQINAARHILKSCEFNKTFCESGLDGLRAWEFKYNEDTQAFSREPIHNWASHPSDAFAYGCQVMAEDDKPISSEDARFPVRAISDSRIIIEPLETLYADIPKDRGRI